MLKGIIAACLSRRAIVLFGLLAFAVAGLYAFKIINIESYPNAITPSPWKSACMRRRGCR